MKTLKIAKNLVYVLALVFIVAACTSDQIEIDEEQNLIEEATQAPQETSTKSKNNTMEILIVWKKGTTEATKEEFRDYYKAEKILLSYVDCEEEDNDGQEGETWTVSADQQAGGNVDPQKPKCCPMAKMLPGKNCADIKK